MATLIRHAERDLVFRDGRALSGRLAGRHRVQRLVAAAEVVLGVEEEDDERLVGFRIVENDDLRRRHVVRTVAALHLALHLRHSFAADAVKRHDSCERHMCLLVESSADPKPSAESTQAFRLSTDTGCMADLTTPLDEPRPVRLKAKEVDKDTQALYRRLFTR